MYNRRFTQSSSTSVLTLSFHDKLEICLFDNKKNKTTTYKIDYIEVYDKNIIEEIPQNMILTDEFNIKSNVGIIDFQENPFEIYIDNLNKILYVHIDRISYTVYNLNFHNFNVIGKNVHKFLVPQNVLLSDTLIKIELYKSDNELVVLLRYRYGFVFQNYNIIRITEKERNDFINLQRYNYLDKRFLLKEFAFTLKNNTREYKKLINEISAYNNLKLTFEDTKRKSYIFTEIKSNEEFLTINITNGNDFTFIFKNINIVHYSLLYQDIKTYILRVIINKLKKQKLLSKVKIIRMSINVDTSDKDFRLLRLLNTSTNKYYVVVKNATKPISEIKITKNLILQFREYIDNKSNFICIENSNKKTTCNIHVHRWKAKSKKTLEKLKYNDGYIYLDDNIETIIEHFFSFYSKYLLIKVYNSKIKKEIDSCDMKEFKTKKDFMSHLETSTKIENYQKYHKYHLTNFFRSIFS